MRIIIGEQFLIFGTGLPGSLLRSQYNHVKSIIQSYTWRDLNTLLFRLRSCMHAKGNYYQAMHGVHMKGAIPGKFPQYIDTVTIFREKNVSCILCGLTGNPEDFQWLEDAIHVLNGDWWGGRAIEFNHFYNTGYFNSHNACMVRGYRPLWTTCIRVYAKQDVINFKKNFIWEVGPGS